MLRISLLAACACVAMPLVAQQQPTASEMAFIYELNRARSDPQGYDTENALGGILNGVVARPPLAINLNLVQSARLHSTEMAANGYFSHQSAVTNEWPNKMARDAGYPLYSSWPDNQNYIESLAARYGSGSSISYSAPEALKALIIDAGVNPPGHREHLLAMTSFAAAFREVGTGYAEGIGNGWPSGAYWSIHTGRRNTDPIWLTGVVYDDSNTNGRYDQGEGLAGVTITATGSSTKNTVSTTGGGWAIDVSAGAWTVSCTGGSFIGTATANVTIASDNIAVDFNSGNAAGEVNFSNQIPSGGGGSGSGGGSDSGGGGCIVNDREPSLWAILLLAFGLFALFSKHLVTGRTGG